MKNIYTSTLGAPGYPGSPGYKKIKITTSYDFKSLRDEIK